MKTLTCACCGSEVTCPQFFDGKVYGYTCIKKVNPAAKQSKVVYVAAELVSVKALGSMQDVIIIINGVKHRKLFLNNTPWASVHTVQDGMMFVNPYAFK